MTPVPAFARMQESTPLEMALYTSSAEYASIIEIETALAVLDRDGSPANPEHLMAYFALHRRYGRAMGHRPMPAKWETP
jgi:hypothetical protein